MTDSWKPVAEHPNYDVSDIGRVRSRRRRSASGGILAQAVVSGYARVSLQKGYGRVHLLVHRLVLEAHVGRCPKGLEAAHLNGNRLDNTLPNLCWVSRKENHSHKKLHGTQQTGERSGSAKLNNKAVAEIRAKRSLCTQKELADRFGVCVGTIQLVQAMKRWVHV